MYTSKWEESNAKLLFLLSIIEYVFMDRLKEIFIFYDLISNYYAYARFYDEIDVAPIIVPYYHLSSDFYHLIWELENWSPYASNTPSGKNLKGNSLYARLDDKLW